MAANAWRSERALALQLREDCSGFDFYQLIRLLAASAAPNGDDQTDFGQRPSGPLPHFVAHSSWAFPTTEVAAVVESPRGWVVSTPNYCVAGYLGPLPEAYTEWMVERSADGDGAMEAFLNLFNDAINRLRYRIKARARLSLNSDRPERTELAAYLGAVQGLSGSEQLPFDRRSLLALAGLKVNRRESAAVIESLLTAYLSAQVNIQQLQGDWRPLEHDDLGRLGRRNTQLGKNAVLGSRVWSQDAGITLNIKNAPFHDLCNWVPGGSGHQALNYLLRYLMDGQFDCQVLIYVDPDTVPAARLQTEQQDKASPGLRLSYTAWLKSERATQDELAGSISLPPAFFRVRGFAAEEG